MKLKKNFITLPSNHTQIQVKETNKYSSPLTKLITSCLINSEENSTISIVFNMSKRLITLSKRIRVADKKINNREIRLDRKIISIRNNTLSERIRRIIITTRDNGNSLDQGISTI